MKTRKILPVLILLAAPAARADEDGEDIGRRKEMPPQGDTVGAVRDVKTLQREVNALSADINILNLANGLHLTPHQVVHLLRAAREAKEVIDDATPPPRKVDLLEKEARALQRIRDAMLEGGEAPKDAIRDVDNLRPRGRAPRLPASEACRRLRELELRVEAEFLPSQLEVIRTYKACLVPPKDLRDPVRVGQASDAGPMLYLLDHARSTPAEKWAKEGDRWIAGIVEQEQEHFGRLNEVELAERQAALRAAFTEARAMDPASYAVRKDLLAERIQPVDRVQALGLEMAGISESFNEPGKVARILLDPRVIPLLERRLARLRAGARLPVDLEAVQEADRCKDGHCAIRKEGAGN